MLKWRKAQDAILFGDMQLIKSPADDVIAFTRSSQEQKLLFIFNYSAKQRKFKLPAAIKSFINQGKPLAPHKFMQRAKLTADTITLPAYSVYISQIAVK